MIVLDSDHLSVLEYPEADQAIRLQDRLRQSADRDDPHDRCVPGRADARLAGCHSPGTRRSSPSDMCMTSGSSRRDARNVTAERNRRSVRLGSSLPPPLATQTRPDCDSRPAASDDRDARLPPPDCPPAPPRGETNGRSSAPSRPTSRSTAAVAAGSATTPPGSAPACPAVSADRSSRATPDTAPISIPPRKNR